MRYLALLALVGGCGWDITRPPQRCYTQRVVGWKADTLWNQVTKESLPAEQQATWQPFVVVSRNTWVDSTRVCP